MHTFRTRPNWKHLEMPVSELDLRLLEQSEFWPLADASKTAKHCVGPADFLRWNPIYEAETKVGFPRADRQISRICSLVRVFSDRSRLASASTSRPESGTRFFGA